MTQPSGTVGEKAQCIPKELGCDEDEAAFRDKLRVIAKQKPKEEAPKPKEEVAR